MGQRLASDLNVLWFNVGTPSHAEFKTHIPLCDPMEEPPMVIDRYDPLARIIREAAEEWFAGSEIAAKMLAAA